MLSISTPISKWPSNPKGFDSPLFSSPLLVEQGRSLRDEGKKLSDYNDSITTWTQCQNFGVHIEEKQISIRNEVTET